MTQKDNGFKEKLDFYKGKTWSKPVSHRQLGESYDPLALKNKPQAHFFTPKSSPKISNMRPFPIPTNNSIASNHHNTEDATPKKVLRRKLLPASEKSQRTKSFNIDFSRIKEENESFRATTPQPMPLITASCNIQKGKTEKLKIRGKSPEEKLTMRGNSIRKLIYQVYEGKPLTESNNLVPEPQILENNINIKVNITLNPHIRPSKRPPVNNPPPSVSPIPQKLKTINKSVLGENVEKGCKATAEKPKKLLKSSTKQVHKNNFQNPAKREVPAPKEGSKEEELNSQVQKLMDNLIKLKNDTNRLYSTLRNNSENKRSVQPQSPFENLYNEIIYKLKKDNNEKQRTPVQK